MEKRLSGEQSGSDTDYEEEGLLFEVGQAEGRILWEEQLKTLLSFSEDILPAALYSPMKWCRISIQQCLKQISEMEEILGNNCKTIKLLEIQLQLWNKARGSSSSKSRFPNTSTSLYRFASDLFYFAFHQNRDYSREIREDLDIAFEAQFGPARLSRARSLLRVYVEHFNQFEDFATVVLPEVLNNESIVSLIAIYLDSIKTEKSSSEVMDLEEKIMEFIRSSDYHETQMLILLLTQQLKCKEIILELLYKHIITEPSESPSTSTTNESKINSPPNFASRGTRSRLKRFIDVDPDLVIKACLATHSCHISLFDIIIEGLNFISKDVMTKRAKTFLLFRPPLFDGSDITMSLPKQYLSFFRQFLEVTSTKSLIGRVKASLSKMKTEKANTGFWMELFDILI